MSVHQPQEAGQRPSWVDDELLPFTSRFIELHGNSVHYLDEGSGPVLLMLHGNPTWSFVYRQAIATLSDRFRCIAPDLPGFGLSTAAPGYGHLPAEHAQVIAALMRRLELSEVTLVLQDWGGPIGLHAAQAEPDRVRALVIGNTWGWPVNGDIHFEMFSRMMGGAVGAELIRRVNLFVNVMIPAGHRRRKLSSAEMQHYRLALPTRERRQASAIFPRQILRGRAFLQEVQDGMDALARLPALIVWADADVAFREKERLRWEQTFPHHSTVVLAGAGHYLQSDAPEEFSDAIARWRLALADAPEGQLAR
jgi:haloalkane dehalogenase